MKRTKENWSAVAVAVIILAGLGYQCSSGQKASKDEPYQTFTTNIDGRGMAITLEFTKGESHNHPLMAIWLEDTTGRYIETLFVAESIGKGIFQHGDKSKGTWQAGPVRRPAALPYWGHKMGYQAPDGYFLPTPEEPMPDAVTGPTPSGNFILKSKATEPLPETFMVILEINQPWDWNDYWTNVRYPDDEQYKTSSQPSVVYAVKIIPASGKKEYTMVPIGHGHYSGKDGVLYPDISTLTTSLSIVKSIRVTLSD